MTTDELEIWKELNELEEVKKVKKRWFIGDKLWDDYGCEYGYIIGFNQMEFLDRHTEDTARVKYYSGLESNLRTVSHEKFWIIPLFDPVRQERSLWGLFKSLPFRCNEDTEWNVLAFAINEARPDLALAKAIVEARR